MAQKTKKQWFRAVRGSYLPANPAGLGVYLLYVLYVAAVAVVWYHDGHSTWWFLVGVIPAGVGAAGVTQYIASRRS